MGVQVFDKEKFDLMTGGGGDKKLITRSKRLTLSRT